ncbi:MAG: DNA primase [Candidatus Moraniibacteriota bacterium]|nr:MAG: DNA primase [Candidatus Moranbacteria bacterium]
MNTEVEDIKARLSVREVITGYIPLTKMGASWKGLCPFHHEKTPSFVVNEERAGWHCFGCNKGGDVFTFVMEMDGLSFPEALELLAARAGVVLERRAPPFHGESRGASSEASSSEAVSKLRLVALLDLSSKFFEKQLFDGAGKKEALPYLLDRGLSEASIRLFRIGFALPGWRTLSDFLVSKHFSLADMEQAGMVVRKSREDFSGNESRSQEGWYDRFRARITFPIFDASGRILGFSARVLPGADDAQAKYVNTPETVLYHKSRALYGFFQAKRAIREAGHAILVEGNTDVIAMYQAGFRNTVAVSGTALTEEHLRFLRRSTDTLKLFFDMDSAGQIAARKSAEMALLLGFSVSIVALSSGKDAAEIARTDPRSLEAALLGALPAPEYFLHRTLLEHSTRTAEGKRRAAESMAGIVRALTHAIERAHWVKHVAERIGISEASFDSVVRSVRSDLSFAQSPEPMNSLEREERFEEPSRKILLDITSVLLAAPHLLPFSVEDFEDRALRAVSELPLLSFLSGISAAEFSFRTIPEDMKSEAARYAFFGEKLLGVSVSEGEASAAPEKARSLLAELVARFRSELRKEEMRALERAMRIAREAGNFSEERELAERLMAVGREG